ncbi:MAG: ABC transporter ATP-binding protein [Candidatus Korarchaeota archaeon]|nr:ABC transporter ATP-binding protein [Thermoproteota archaeon]
MLKVEDLYVSYGIIPVLRGVTINVKEGEIVALLGANGSGKTTLLKTISGLIKCSRGEITFLGRDIRNLPPYEIVKAGIVQVPEGREIFPYLTVKENLLMGAIGSKAAWKSRHDSLKMVFELFPPLKERSEMQARFLSGGEQQMLAIGRGLMAKPKLLMIDEPSLGLAPIVFRKIYDVITTLPGKNITVLLSEQNAHYALKIADRGYVLENGVVVLEGSSKELQESELIKKAYMGM